MTESEIWKDAVGYEGFYKVSNKGNVYSVERIDSINRKRGGFTLEPRTTKRGYLDVNLCKNGILKRKLIHRLVAEAFIPDLKKYPGVNHKDEDKTNNNVENLEWCDTIYNNNHGTRNKRIGQKLSKKMKAVNVKTGEFITFSSGKEAINKGYSRAVYEACNGIYKSSNGNLIGGDGRTYRGLKWSYE